MPFATPESVNDVEVDLPTEVYGPALVVARLTVYPVAPTLAAQARTIWLLPGVAVTPLGAGGADGAGAGEEPLEGQVKAGKGAALCSPRLCQRPGQVGFLLGQLHGPLAKPPGL